MNSHRAALAPFLFCVLLLASCDRESGGALPPSEAAGCLELSTFRVLNFEGAPVIPSSGGFLVGDPSGQRTAFVDRNLPYEILIFDESGVFEQSLGRAGDGPGEYRRISGLAFDSADSLWVLSRRGLRADVYGPDLEWARSMDLERPVRRFAPLRDGFFVAVISLGSDTEIEILNREGTFHATGIAVPPVPPGAFLSSMAELIQLATDRVDRFWLSVPYSHQIWEGHLDGGSRLLAEESPTWFHVDYPEDVKQALEGLIDPGGSTVLALQYDSDLDALWVSTGVPVSSLEASDLEGIQDPASMVPLIIDHVVEAIDVAGGEVRCTERFDFLDISPDGGERYRVREDMRLEWIRPRIR